MASDPQSRSRRGPVDGAMTQGTTVGAWPGGHHLNKPLGANWNRIWHYMEKDAIRAAYRLDPWAANW